MNASKPSSPAETESMAMDAEGELTAWDAMKLLAALPEDMFLVPRSDPPPEDRKGLIDDDL